MLYAYLVSAKSDTHKDSCVVIAETATQAKKVAFEGSSYMRDWEWIDLRAHRVPKEAYLEEKEPMDSPHWVYDIETFERIQEHLIREYWHDQGFLY